MNTWTEVVVLSVAEPTVPLVHQIVQLLGQIQEYWKRNIIHFEASNQTNKEVPHIVSPFRDDWVQDDTFEEKNML